MALPLANKNETTGWYEGKNTCYVCNKTYEWSEGSNAELVAERTGRYDGNTFYIEFAVYSKCTECKHKNKRFYEVLSKTT